MISVIIPVYNVETYLPRCLESCISAASVVHAEIIVVDDGSTDSSGRIAEGYSARYKDLRVFHTQNHGLSAARNYGIEQAWGDWLMFVDSDDWVAPDYCLLPYRAAKEYSADLVAFNIFRMTKTGRIKDRAREHHPSGIISREEAIEFAGVVAWNKLYKRELFQEIRYPAGRVYEDVATTHKLIYRAKKIVWLDERLIYHFYRSDSISHTSSPENRRDSFLSLYERYCDLCALGYPRSKAGADLQGSSIGWLVRSIPPSPTDGEGRSDLNDESEAGLYRRAERIVDEIRGIPKAFTWRRKILLMIWRTDKRLFHTVCRIFGKKQT